MKNKFLSVIKKKWLKSVVLTIVLFAIIISAYVGIMYAINKFTLPDFDFTKDKIYSITQTTKDKLQNLEVDVTIYPYNMQQYVDDLAHKYTNVNKHIKVEELENLTSKLDWQNNYEVTDADSFIVIEAQGKEKILFSSDLYTYDYSTYEEIDITEEAITNGILDVITNVKPKVCFLTGHNLYSTTYFQYMQSLLYTEMNEIEETDILIAPNYYLNYVININNENIDSIIIRKGYYSNSGETTNLIYRYDAGNYTLN